MDGEGSSGRLSACIEGAVLLVMLGALGLGLLAVHTERNTDEGEARDLATEEPDQGPNLQVLFVDRPPVHLVILVDVGEPLAAAGEFSRRLDAGMSWAASMEVIEATESALLGLEEAKTTCAAGACPPLVVLDLRVAGS
jgi:hypothetical protein